jgi:hypothetical protein
MHCAQCARPCALHTLCHIGCLQSSGCSRNVRMHGHAPIKRCCLDPACCMCSGVCDFMCCLWDSEGSISEPHLLGGPRGLHHTLSPGKDPSEPIVSSLSCAVLSVTSVHLLMLGIWQHGTCRLWVLPIGLCLLHPRSTAGPTVHHVGTQRWSWVDMAVAKDVKHSNQTLYLVTSAALHPPKHLITN